MSQVSLEGMPLTWKMLKEANFAWEGYGDCDRFGAWEAEVDAVVYSKGSRVSATGKGGRAGLHLYVRAVGDDRKFWLFVFFFPASEIYKRAKSLNAGDRIRVEIVPGQDNHAVMKALELLQ